MINVFQNLIVLSLGICELEHIHKVHLQFWSDSLVSLVSLVFARYHCLGFVGFVGVLLPFFPNANESGTAANRRLDRWCPTTPRSGCPSSDPKATETQASKQTIVCATHNHRACCPHFMVRSSASLTINLVTKLFNCSKKAKHVRQCT